MRKPLEGCPEATADGARMGTTITTSIDHPPAPHPPSRDHCSQSAHSIDHVIQVLTQSSRDQAATNHDRWENAAGQSNCAGRK